MNKNDASKSLLQASSHSSCNEEFTFKTFPLILHMLSRRGLNCIFLMKSYFTRSSNQYLLRLKNIDYVNLRGLTNCFPALANSDRTSFNGSINTESYHYICCRYYKADFLGCNNLKVHSNRQSNIFFLRRMLIHTFTIHNIFMGRDIFISLFM